MRLLWTSAVRVTTPSTRSASKSLRSREALRSKATRLWMWLLGVGHCPASLIPRLPGAPGITHQSAGRHSNTLHGRVRCASGKHSCSCSAAARHHLSQVTLSWRSGQHVRRHKNTVMSRRTDPHTHNPNPRNTLQRTSTRTVGAWYPPHWYVYS